MMANSVPSTGMMVLTHTHPQHGGQSVVPTTSSRLQTFLKAESGVLGTVQIMTGIVELMFGIVTATFYPTISTYSGVAFWGAINYIITGSLGVAANKKLNPCLVKASLGMNIVSAVAAGISIILFGISMAISLHYYHGWYGYNRDYNDLLKLLESQSAGIAGVMLVLSVLEFIVSIGISAFACKATCSSGSEVLYVSNQVPSSYMSYPSAPLQSTSGAPFLSHPV